MAGHHATVLADALLPALEALRLAAASNDTAAREAAGPTIPAVLSVLLALGADDADVTLGPQALRALLAGVDGALDTMRRQHFDLAVLPDPHVEGGVH